MPLYESVFIARQDIPAQEVEALAERFAGVVAEQGGEIARREYWGLKNMAYKIKKNRKGHYTMFHIDAPAGAVREMERTMRISEDVLRCLTVKVDSFPEGPTIMMQTRAAREDRRRDERRARAARRRSEERNEQKAEDKQPQAAKAEDKPEAAAAPAAAAPAAETAAPPEAGTAEKKEPAAT